MQTDRTIVTLTSEAKTYLRSVAEEGKHISLGVKSGGCSGFEYVWSKAEDYPHVHWSDPIDDILVVDPLAELYIGGSEIDYITELGGSYLTIRNPMQSSSCGCGSSFGV